MSGQCGMQASDQTNERANERANERGKVVTTLKFWEFETRQARGWMCVLLM